MYNAVDVAKNAKPNRVAQYVGYNATPALSRVGSDESHFSVSQDNAHKPQPFWREWRAEAESSPDPSAWVPV